MDYKKDLELDVCVDLEGVIRQLRPLTAMERAEVRIAVVESLTEIEKEVRELVRKGDDLIEVHEKLDEFLKNMDIAESRLGVGN